MPGNKHRRKQGLSQPPLGRRRSKTWPRRQGMMKKGYRASMYLPMGYFSISRRQRQTPGGCSLTNWSTRMGPIATTCLLTWCVQEDMPLLLGRSCTVPELNHQEAADTLKWKEILQNICLLLLTNGRFMIGKGRLWDGSDKGGWRDRTAESSMDHRFNPGPQNLFCYKEQYRDNRQDLHPTHELDCSAMLVLDSWFDCCTMGI